jgi:hypothetical protein
MQRHRASPYARLFSMVAIGEAAYATIMQALQTCKGLGLTKFQCAELMLDPRPHVRRRASQFIGSTEGINLGNALMERSRRFW